MKIKVDFKSVFTIIVKSFVIFLLLFAICFVMRFLSCALPQAAIKQNITKEIETLLAPGDTLLKESVYTGVWDSTDFFTECKYIANAYMNDRTRPLYETMYTTSHIYPEGSNGPVDALYKTIGTEPQKTYSYAQLWFGAMVVIRPMLMFLTYSQALKLWKVIIYILIFASIIMCYKKYNITLAAPIGLSLIFTNIDTGLSLFHTSFVFLLAFVGIITALSIRNKENYCYLMVAIGTLTAFFDWQSTPVITYVYPAIVILFILYNKNEIVTVTEGIIGTIIYGALWVFGYGAMQVMKWAIASLYLKKNVFAMGLGHMGADITKEGIEGVYDNFFVRGAYALFKNFTAIEVVNLFANKAVAVIIAVMFLLIVSLIAHMIYLYNKDKNKNLALAFVLIIVAVPQLLYFIAVSGFCTIHWWFAYRGYSAVIAAFLSSLIIFYQYYKEVNIK